ncbi:unnamed protein product [Linum tenue]|uniref:Uncharacterized protein n=1 Tax=Linum tenue TaxID=586396 RepID=A0AAV0RYD6_9ROSI|nr:unnamed protein product [Linum tenue]
MMGRSPCCNVVGLKKGAWTSEEDQKLIAYIQEHGEGGWRTLPQKAGLQRCGKSCRLRWANYLRPDIKRGEFSPEDEERILELHASLGNRWSAIARHLPRRTDNEIKNYWNTHLKKRLFDATTHRHRHSPTTTTASSSASAPSRRINTEQAGAENDVVQRRPSSSSAKLLNKMASRLAHPLLHCLDSILSLASSSTAATSSQGQNDPPPHTNHDLAFLDSLLNDDSADTSKDLLPASHYALDGLSTSAGRNNDPVDYGVDDQVVSTTDDAYAHHQFHYHHGAGGLLDGDDEHGRTFFNNYAHFRIDAPAFF